MYQDYKRTDFFYKIHLLPNDSDSKIGEKNLGVWRRTRIWCMNSRAQSV